MPEQREVLERAPDAQRGAAVRPQMGDVLPLEADTTLGRPVSPRNAVDHRGLTGAVRAYDGENFTTLNGERDVGQRPDATEAQAHRIRFEDSRIPSHLVAPSPFLSGDRLGARATCWQQGRAAETRSYPRSAMASGGSSVASRSTPRPSMRRIEPSWFAPQTDIPMPAARRVAQDSASIMASCTPISANP